MYSEEARDEDTKIKEGSPERFIASGNITITDEDASRRKKKLLEEDELLRAERIRNFLAAVDAASRQDKDKDPLARSQFGNLPEVLSKPANDIYALATPPVVGQPVLAHCVGNIGKPVEESRLKGICKTLGGMAVPIATTMSLKIAISMGVSIALPAAAPVLVPAIFLAMSGKALHKSAVSLKEKMDQSRGAHENEGMSPVKAFIEAVKENKFKAGMLLGSTIMLTAGVSGVLDQLADPIANALNNLQSPVNVGITAPAADLQSSPLDQKGGKSIFLPPEVKIMPPEAVPIPIENFKPVSFIPAVEATPEVTDASEEMSAPQVAETSTPVDDSKFTVTDVSTTEVSSSIIDDQANLHQNADAIVSEAPETNVSLPAEAATIYANDIHVVEPPAFESSTEIAAESSPAYVIQSRFGAISASVDSTPEPVTQAPTAVSPPAGAIEEVGPKPEVQKEAAVVAHDPRAEMPPIVKSAWNNLQVIRDDQAFEAQLIDAMDKGIVKSPADGIITVGKGGEVYFTREMTPGSNDYVTHKITSVYDNPEMQKRILGDVTLSKAHVASIMTSPGDEKILETGVNKALEALEKSGGNAQDGIIQTVRPSGVSGPSISLHAFKNDTGETVIKFINTEYRGENQSVLNQAYKQTPDVLRTMPHDPKSLTDISEKIISESIKKGPVNMADGLQIPRQK